MNCTSLFTIIICIVYLCGMQAQDDSLKTYPIVKSNTTIQLDGKLTPEEWAPYTEISDFWMKFPINTTPSHPHTRIKMTYDDQYIYIGVIGEINQPTIVQSLKRDQGLRTADGIGIVLDPVNLKTNGFYFSVTPANSQSEGLIGNGFDDIDFTWDNTWYSNAHSTNDYWSIEIAIPFSILRFEPEKTTWGINFIRSVRAENEFHTWTHMPLQFRGTDLGYVGQLIWDSPPPPGGSKITLNPYITQSTSADFESSSSTSFATNVGMDAKISLSPSLNLDLTFNPDFSNVDVDQQVTNLTRFSIFFPERRVFFLENADLFSNYGIPPIRPFYSRRIGSKEGEAVPIIGGVRLSGNVTKQLRIGLMNIQTGRKNDLSPDNFTVFTFNRQFGARSVVKGYGINRVEIQNEQEKSQRSLERYARNFGGELLLTNAQGTMQAWAGSHISFKPNLKNDNLFANGGGGYFGQNFSSFIDVVHAGQNYTSDVGFVNRIENYDASRDTVLRRGFDFLYNETGYTFYFQKGLFNNIVIYTENFLAYDDSLHFNERNNVLRTNFNFTNSSNINFAITNNAIQLIYPFGFVENAPPLPRGRYTFTNYQIQYTSDQRANIVLTLSANNGRFYNGRRTQLSGGFIFRRQPYMSFNVNLEYNDLIFPEQYGTQKYLLIASQIEINFRNNLFWTSFLQFNTQANNFNINSRVQWRYKPMSDFFLVYTDNYFTDPLFTQKNRALVLKANYWINL